MARKVIDYLRDFEADTETKSVSLLCVDEEEADAIMRDRAAMEALRAFHHGENPCLLLRDYTGWNCDLDGSGPYRADDPAAAILAAQETGGGGDG